MRVFVYILSVVVVLFTSCQSDLGSESFVNIEDEYELFVTQELTENGGLGSLEIRTSQELECSNYSIPYELSINNENIDLTLDNVTIEGACIAQMAVAKQVVHFKLHNSQKDINISLQNVISNTGIVVANDDEILLQLASNDGIKISKAKINRIKKNMMWGYIRNGESDSIEKLNAYIENIASAAELDYGDYGYFYINNDNQLQLYDAVHEASDKTFAFFSDTSIGLIEEKILEIKESDPSLVFHMTIYNGQAINVI